VTLIEIAVATAIAAFLLLLSAEGFGAAMTRTQGRSAAAELSGVLRTARHAAMMQRHPVQVAFAADDTTVTVTGAELFGLGRYDLGTKAVHVDSLSGGRTITFYPSGRSASPTTIQLANASADRWRITVAMTGRITIH
jgi:Tfp pilus assembly protein FimT